MWIWIVLTAFIASFASAYLARRQMSKKTSERYIGELFVDPLEPEDQGGVYVAFDKDPKELSDGETVMLRVKLVRK